MLKIVDNDLSGTKGTTPVIQAQGLAWIVKDLARKGIDTSVDEVQRCSTYYLDDHCLVVEITPGYGYPYRFKPVFCVLDDNGNPAGY
jgi:hypothetical protein